MTDDRSQRGMNERSWSTRVVVRYALLQVPAAVLLVLILILVRRWVEIPAWSVWGLVALWVAKDVALFPFVWRSYTRDRPGESNSMVGVRGIAKDRLDPSGYVRVRGELWQAEVMRGGPPISSGEGVKVRGTRGLTLLVQPDNEKSTQ